MHPIAISSIRETILTMQNDVAKLLALVTFQSDGPELKNYHQHRINRRITNESKHHNSQNSSENTLWAECFLSPTCVQLEIQYTVV